MYGYGCGVFVWRQVVDDFTKKCNMVVIVLQQGGGEVWVMGLTMDFGATWLSSEAHHTMSLRQISEKTFELARTRDFGVLAKYWTPCV